MARRTAGLRVREYRKRIRAWSLYDWANSAFATTVLAAVLPAYYSEVAGATLPSPATATAYWAAGLAFSFFVVALISPVLGTISDILRAKKFLLGVFVTVGATGTGLLVLVSTGDWLLASLLFLVGHIGFGASNVFYDALLPHVATEDDEDRVSARGYAMGYLGGGLLLIINVVMILTIPDDNNWGVRLSFATVALWWIIFTIPLMRRVPEPPAATARLRQGTSVVGESFRRIRRTFGSIRHFRQLFIFLIAFLLYENGIGTVIGVSVIYGAELGFGTLELVSALILVQFVAIPFAIMFGRIPNRKGRRRGVILAFVLFNLVALPIAGAVAARTMDGDIVGLPGDPYPATETALGDGEHLPSNEAVQFEGAWEVVPQSELLTGARTDYAVSSEPGATLTIPYNGQRIELRYSEGPAHGTWRAEIDGAIALDDDGEEVIVDAFRSSSRFEVPIVIEAEQEGEHVLTVINLPDRNPDSVGNLVRLGEFTVAEPVRDSNLGAIIGAILVLQAIGIAFAFLLGRPLFGRLAKKMDTKRTIMLALVAYTGIVVWGYFLDAVVEFWFLAWMVAVVQGGSQALSRSLYASMSPASQSGEFFGFFSSMSRFAAVLGPAFFAIAVGVFDSSRPAVLLLAVLFLAGMLLLSRVNVEEGRRVAREYDAGALRYPRHVEGGLENYGRSIR